MYCLTFTEGLILTVSIQTLYQNCPCSLWLHLTVFTARQHTDARFWYSNSICPSVCPTVRLSDCPIHASNIWKRLKIYYSFYHHTVAQSRYSVLWVSFIQEILSVELGVCPMQLFHFWWRDVHPVQNLLLCTKFHENPMIFHWDMAI